MNNGGLQPDVATREAWKASRARAPAMRVRLADVGRGQEPERPGKRRTADGSQGERDEIGVAGSRSGGERKAGI